MKSILVVGKMESFKIQITKVANVIFDDLVNFSQGKGPENETTLHALTCLSTVLHYTPSINYASVGSNFFSSRDSSRISGGLEIWRGYHQSIRALMAGHLGINVDLTNKAFYTSGMPLIDYAMQVMGARDIRDLLRKPRYVFKLFKY